MSDTKSRGRLYIYGERTEILTIQVPASKKEEVKAEFYAVLKKYEDPKNLILEPKAKPVISDQEEIAPEPENFIDEVIVSDSGVTLTTGKEVSALPKDKKKISTGLYSAGDKFYTNKIVDNQLQILEWTSKESAEEYLSNLK
ncbi:MAG: hypothetical protein V4666_08080 [Bacteroidota bacterium]